MLSDVPLAIASLGFSEGAEGRAPQEAACRGVVVQQGDKDSLNSL